MDSDFIQLARQWEALGDRVAIAKVTDFFQADLKQRSDAQDSLQSWRVRAAGDSFGHSDQLRSVTSLDRHRAAMATRIAANGKRSS